MLDPTLNRAFEYHGVSDAILGPWRLQTVSTIYESMGSHGWLSFDEFVSVVEVRNVPLCAFVQLHLF